MTHLSLSVSREGDVATVALSGELDISEADEVEQMLRKVEASAPQTLLLDMRQLTFIDSTGLRLVLEADARAREEARQVTLVRGPDPVHRVFLIALLDQRLNFVEDPREAREATEKIGETQ